MAVFQALSKASQSLRMAISAISSGHVGNSPSQMKELGLKEVIYLASLGEGSEADLCCESTSFLSRVPPYLAASSEGLLTRGSESNQWGICEELACSRALPKQGRSLDT